MATAVVGKALSYVGDKLLAYFTDDMLNVWAASMELGDNVRALELELLSVKAVLEHILDKEITNLALKQLLEKLQDLGYEADDVLDEMDYFRIQDTLYGTFHAANQHAQGWVHNLALNVHHTAEATAGKLNCLPASSRACCDTIIHAVGKCFHCSPLLLLHDDGEENSDNSMQHTSQERYHTNEPPKLTFDRVAASDKMKSIVVEMQKLRQRISEIITTIGSQWVKIPNSAHNHRNTTCESIEPRLYGRHDKMNSIVDDIINGKYSSEVLTVIPIVGPGGIGKTALAQHIYHSEKLQKHFDLKVWRCVSLNFDVNKLMEEIHKSIPKVDNERIGTPGELIGQRLIKGRKLLLVLDDIWDLRNEDQWKQLLLPFKKSQERGNVILATTRLPEQAQKMTQKAGHTIHLQGLETEEFQKLFLDIVFGDNDQSRQKHKFLFDVGFKIAGRLKGSPLAAKTVGRLLKKHLNYNYWTGVLESDEWKQSKDENDIMPALKLSFDYLPSQQLKQCIFYCAMFPQDYKFREEDLINFWIGQEIVNSSCGENKMVEETERDHLTKLVDYGFLERNQENGGSTYYNIHDLLHELARKVSSHECLVIDSSRYHEWPVKLPPSIRHLSINIEDTSVNGRLILKNCVEDFNTLLTRLKFKKLWTLMLFGEHHGCFVKAFGDLFREAKALRVIFLSKASYNVKYLLCNFYSLLRLRYLRIESSSLYKARFPIKLSRFYHMMVIDAKYCDVIDLPRDISNLVKLRHLLVENDRVYSSIVDVGKLKSLQELRRFMVKQEDQGFELRQTGHLVDLCELSIYNLQNVQVKEEADEAKLLTKSHLLELILHWENINRSTDDFTLEEYVLERLKPNINLLKLSIKGNRGACCPSWLGTNLYIKNLESLCLDGVRWKTFPPIGQLLLLDNVSHDELPGNIPKERFGNLKKLELCNLSMVQKWALHYPCQLFPFLEVLIINDCPKLVELSFQHIDACCQQGKEVNANFFPRLSKLKITNCPQLLSFPPIPWSEAPCSINIEGIGSSSLHKLVCEKENNYGYSLLIVGKKDTSDSTFWSVLAFHNLTRLKELQMWNCQSMPLCYIQMLSFLRKLDLSCTSNAFPFVEADWHAKYQFPVESLVIHEWNASGKELTQLLVYFLKLSYLRLSQCKKITGLAVNMRGHHTTEIPGPSSPADKVEDLQGASAEDDIIVISEEAKRGLLLLPPQLRELEINFCLELSLLCSSPHEDRNEEDGRKGGRGGGGLQGLTSLRQLVIRNCPKLLSAYSSSSFSSSSFSSSFPFPNSLQDLMIWGEVGTGAPSLSNLTALTSLGLIYFGDLRGEGLLPLLTQGHLTKLSVRGTPNFFVDSFFVDSEPSQVHEQELPPCSSKLQELVIDDVAGFTAVLIHCSLLFSRLTKLEIYKDNKVERFTEEQEDLLFFNSLEGITFFYCNNLQSLPKRLHGLPNLKRLCIWGSKAIQMLHKDGLPSSLQELEICYCPEIQSLAKDCLPDSLQRLEIHDCPAIRSLPDVDDLPSLLREIDVRNSNSEELWGQCHKLINIIPIVRV